MRYALLNNERTEPTVSGQIAICPCCKKEVRAFCGKLTVWHWKHISLQDCDSWYEPETEWHRKWKNKFSVKNQEVVCFDVTGEKHIADIKFDNDVVIEFQNSPIKIEEIESRNKFYKKLIWILNGEKFKDNFRVDSCMSKGLIERIYITLKKKLEPKPIEQPVELVKDSDYNYLSNMFFSDQEKLVHYKNIQNIIEEDKLPKGIRWINKKSIIALFNQEKVFKLFYFKWRRPNNFHYFLDEANIFVDLGDRYLYKITNDKIYKGLSVRYNCVRIKKTDFIKKYKQYE